MKFSLQDLFAVTCLAAIVLGVGVSETAAGNPKELSFLSWVFIAAASVYVALRFFASLW
jgi:hypothetical protein